jgi:hypothetical protein
MTLCDADKILQESWRAQVFLSKPSIRWLRRGRRNVHDPCDASAGADKVVKTRQVNQTDALV